MAAPATPPAMSTLLTRAILALVALAGFALPASLTAAPSTGAAPTPSAGALPTVIRIGVATGGVGSPPRFGGSTAGVLNARGTLEKAFEADGTRVDAPIAPFLLTVPRILH